MQFVEDFWFCKCRKPVAYYRIDFTFALIFLIKTYLFLEKYYAKVIFLIKFAIYTIEYANFPKL